MALSAYGLRVSKGETNRTTGVGAFEPLNNGLGDSQVGRKVRGRVYA